MNQFYRQLTRKALPTALLTLLLAVACAFCGIGFSAWRTSERQLAAMDSQYTTIAAPKGQHDSESEKNWRSPYFEDGRWLPLSQHTERAYPGLLGEEFRSCLIAQAQGLSSLSAYEQWDFRSQFFDAYSNQMAVLAVRYIGPSEEQSSYPGYDLYFSLEDVVCRKPEHDLLPEELTISLQSDLRTEEGEIPFEEGHTYLLFGYHEGPTPYIDLEENLYRKEGEPRWTIKEPCTDSLTTDEKTGEGTSTYFYLESGYTGEATDRSALFLWREVQGEEGRYPTLTSDSRPFYAEYEGDWRAFLESEEGTVWREEVIPLCQLNYEAVNVILTDDINTMVLFNNGRADLLEGRKISREEYAAGAPVCLVSAAYAQKNGLTVGDTIDLDFYKTQMNYKMEFSEEQNVAAGSKKEPVWICDPCTPENRLDIEKEYTIVGIYTAPEFDLGWQSFNGNTVFVPKASIPDAAQYEDSMNPMLCAIILENGKAEEFEAYLESIGFGGLFEYYDQDYNAASAAFAAIAANARRLFLIGLGALALAGLLFLFLSLRRLAPTARGMRLMGIPAKKVWLELWTALAGLVLASAALGAVLGGALYGAVTDRTLAEGVALRPEALAVCGALQAAALLACAALAAVPAARPRLMRAGRKK